MSPMPTPPPLKQDPVRIEICKDAADLANHAARQFIAEAGKAFGSRGSFHAALSGGRTPREMYSLLPEPNFAFQVVWPAVHVYWSDERCVAPDDSESNYLMARETFLEKVGIPEANIHRMRGEDSDPRAAADAYEALLRERLGPRPSLDLVMLGLGEDGHTASLFPGTPAIQESDRLVTVGQAPGGEPRLTLTPAAINAARVVMILVQGEGKAGVARQVLGSGSRPAGLPVEAIRPDPGQLIWLLDSAAASELESGA